jgi:hypothetical protein
MNFSISFVITFVIALLIALLCAYLLLRYLYGNRDPREWKSLLFTEKDTYRTMIFPNKGKGKPKEANNSVLKISHNKTDEPDGRN